MGGLILVGKRCEQFEDKVLICRRSMYFSLMLGFLESSAVGTILVSVGKEFNDTIHVQWIVLAYLLTYLGEFTNSCANQLYKMSKF